MWKIDKYCFGEPDKSWIKVDNDQTLIKVSTIRILGNKLFSVLYKKVCSFCTKYGIKMLAANKVNFAVWKEVPAKADPYVVVCIPFDFVEK